ncbi:MAG: hypothetical protein HY390_01620 [Deltaproteobacteria bacterium]|nr:hypothetical protein [Deltaproteobacteria bacterium]
MKKIVVIQVLIGIIFLGSFCLKVKATANEEASANYQCTLKAALDGGALQTIFDRQTIRVDASPLENKKLHYRLSLSTIEGDVQSIPKKEQTQLTRFYVQDLLNDGYVMVANVEVGAKYILVGAFNVGKLECSLLPK